MVYASPPGSAHTSYKLLGNWSASGKYWRRGPPTVGWDGTPLPPEWFWPRNMTTYGQLCWSNKSLVEYITTRVKGFLRSQPDTNIISVSQNDNHDYCQSPEEMAIIDAEVRTNTQAVSLLPTIPFIVVWQAVMCMPG
jgi:hypothetical protein